MLNHGVTKEVVLAPSADNGVLAAGIKVLDCPTGDCKGKSVIWPASAKHGTFVFYNNKTGMSVDPSATPGTGPLVFGMFHSSRNNGVVDSIIKIAGDKISSKLITSLRASAARGGQEEVSRGMFSCVSGNKLYSLNIDWTSDQTRKQFYKNRRARITASYIRKPGDCEGCDDATVCMDVAKGIVDDFYAQVGNTDVPIWPYILRHNEAPVHLFVQHKQNYVFNLSGVESTCNGCDSYTGIKGISIQGKTFTFSNTLNSTTTSSHTQIKELVDNIRCSFGKHEGFAWKENGLPSGNCLPICIKVNTDLDNVKLIKYDDTLIEPTTVEPIYFTKGGVTYDCSIGAVGDMAEENCNCEGISDDPVLYFPTNVILSSVEGFNDFTFEVVDTAMQPINLGSQIWMLQYMSDVRPGLSETQQRTGGFINSLQAWSRSKGVEIDCSAMYCVISWNQKAGDYHPHPYETEKPVIVSNILAIKHGFTSTISALLADLNAIKNVDNCLDIDDITCNIDATPDAPSPTPSSTPFATPSVTPTVTRTVSVTPSVTPTVTKTPSVTPSPSH